MKRQVRRGVFETNSSSVHSLTIVAENEYDKWKNGELYFDKWNKCFTTEEELLKDFQEFNKESDESNEMRRSDYGTYTYAEWNDWDYMDYETYSKSFESPSGDKMVAFGYYGHD